ncbi:hypothetical protein [Salinicoccus sediminis]|nr:hypothetical protein [Salinicoccus sediminis]
MNILPAGSDMDDESKKTINTYLAMGISLGITFGAVLGLLAYILFWNVMLIPAGIIFGITVGLAAGYMYGRRRADKTPPKQKE